MRYGLLETIRQFAEERLAEMGEVGANSLRHAQFFADDSDAHFKKWLSPRQLDAHEWLDREMDNLRSAFRWARDNEQTDLAARIAPTFSIWPASAEGRGGKLGQESSIRRVRRAIAGSRCC